MKLLSVANHLKVNAEPLSHHIVQNVLQRMQRTEQSDKHQNIGLNIFDGKILK